MMPSKPDVRSAVAATVETAVLVVEDHAFQRHALCRLLQRAGVQEILQAENGESALALLRARGATPLVVITDLEMPTMDGVEFIGRLASAAPWVQLAILSAQDEALLRAVRLLARDLGVRFAGALAKPIGLAQLGALLEAARAAPDRPRAPIDPLSAAEVREAIAQGWLRAHFQPKVALTDGVPTGFEALARIEHPSLGLIGPARFLPALEAAGMQRALTDRMLADAGALLQAIRQSHPGLSVSVNLTLPEVSEPRDAERLAAAVRAAGSSPEHVVFEITENAVATHWTIAVENLVRLRMRGFALSIDDFGTGHASLHQLLRLPVSELKLDRSFIEDIDSGQTARVMVQSTVDMAAKLGLTTVAEGLETPAAIATLRRMGCDIGQGYGLARPMSLDAGVDWLRSQTAQDRLRQA